MLVRVEVTCPRGRRPVVLLPREVAVPASGALLLDLADSPVGRVAAAAGVVRDERVLADRDSGNRVAPLCVRPPTVEEDLDAVAGLELLDHPGVRPLDAP